MIGIMPELLRTLMLKRILILLLPMIMLQILILKRILVLLVIVIILQMLLPKNLLVLWLLIIIPRITDTEGNPNDVTHNNTAADTDTYLHHCIEFVTV